MLPSAAVLTAHSRAKMIKMKTSKPFRNSLSETRPRGAKEEGEGEGEGERGSEIESQV